MRVNKYIDISQEIEIDLTVGDLVLIFDEKIDLDGQHHIFRQITSAYQFMKALPDKFIDYLNDEQKKAIYGAFSDTIERFKPKTPETAKEEKSKIVNSKS